MDALLEQLARDPSGDRRRRRRRALAVAVVALTLVVGAAASLRNPVNRPAWRPLILVAAARAQADRPQVVVVPVEGGEERVIAEGDLPALTVDGREVVFATGAGHSQIAAASFGGGPQRVLGELPGKVEGIAVGPDGMVHVAVAGSGDTTAWRVPPSSFDPTEVEPGVAKVDLPF